MFSMHGVLHNWGCLTSCAHLRLGVDFGLSLGAGKLSKPSKRCWRLSPGPNSSSTYSSSACFIYGLLFVFCSLHASSQALSLLYCCPLCAAAQHLASAIINEPQPAMTHRQRIWAIRRVSLSVLLLSHVTNCLGPAGAVAIPANRTGACLQALQTGYLANLCVQPKHISLPMKESIINSHSCWEHWQSQHRK